MAKVFFNKHIINNKFVLSTGAAAPFEQIADNQGLLSLDSDNPAHQLFITELTKAAKEHRGGIEIIDEATYNKKKASMPFNPLDSVLKRQKNMLGVAPTFQDLRPKRPAAPPAGQEGNGAAPQVPQQIDAPPRNGEGLRLDGPTRQEFIEAGGDLKNYPPAGFAERNTPAATDPILKKRGFKPKVIRKPETAEGGGTVAA